MLIFVWAQDKQGLIGKNGQLPWHLPNDLKFFKEVTLGQSIVVGRATFEGMGKRLLPNRHTMVMSKQANYDANGAEVVSDLQTIIEDSQFTDLYVIGGAMLFEELQDHVQVLYCTKINENFDGDTYFPSDFPWNDFVKMKSIAGICDEKNKYEHRFEIYQRKEANDS